MKNSPLTTFLLVILALSAVLSVISCGFYVSSTREFRSLQGQITMINDRNGMISAFLNETVEYSKRNPAIDPILEAAGIKPPKSATAPAAKPTGN